MTQVPVGGGGGGGGLTAAGSGVHPLSLTVAVGVRPLSLTVIVQSGAPKPDAWILKLPLVSDRDPAALVEDSAVMKIPRAALDPSTRSWPPLSSARETVTAEALAGTSSNATRTNGGTRRRIDVPFEGVMHIRQSAPLQIQG